MTYDEFIESKATSEIVAGFEVDPATLNPALFPFQRDLVVWALRKGKSALFAECGLGKSLMQLAWADAVSRHTMYVPQLTNDWEEIPGCVLILAPLAVAQQTLREAERFEIEARVCESHSDVGPGINITNYQKLHLFDTSIFDGVVCDESSILKSFSGKTRTDLIESFAKTPFRLACTATPAPNDHMELGNHAEFLGVMSRTEMLAMYFVHDGGDTSKWRLKGHGEQPFWRWVAGWGVMVRKPSDLGYNDTGYNLPALHLHESVIEMSQEEAFDSGQLFATMAHGLMEQRRARKFTMVDRIERCAELVNNSDESWIVWCELNDEGNQLEKLINGAVQIAGKDSDAMKTHRIMGFIEGRYRVVVTKLKIVGFGMNLQHCRNMAFVGVSHSWEQFYQGVRRCWRFGQRQEVHVHMFAGEAEGAVLASLKAKQKSADEMADKMLGFTREIQTAQIHRTELQRMEYQRDCVVGNGWSMYLGDCVEVTREIPSDSIHYSIFSPPFASLYVYSNSDRDMGNVKDDAEFAAHLGYLIDELYRIIMPGRLVSFHCMNLPTSKVNDGYIGIRDFRGNLIRAFQERGFIYHSEVCIWKDPVTAMQRTKALGLLHKQVKKDSCMSRQGIADYLVTMRKPGENPERVTHTKDSFPVDVWQRYASPVWMDIDANDTLQYRAARDSNDERHICPLQLPVIRRGIQLWSNPGDTVLSPFGGIASEGFVAVEMGRKYIGIELKPSYWKQAVRNLNAATEKANELQLMPEGLFADPLECPDDELDTIFEDENE